LAIISAACPKHCPVLPGCHSRGDTFEESFENIKDVIKTYLIMIEKEIN
jgi:predicted RNase H-like HicB family nuclease